MEVAFVTCLKAIVDIDFCDTTRAAESHTIWLRSRPQGSDLAGHGELLRLENSDYVSRREAETVSRHYQEPMRSWFACGGWVILLTRYTDQNPYKPYALLSKEFYVSLSRIPKTRTAAGRSAR
jgi:hypothetical protein